jgi:hypothetical protein
MTALDHAIDSAFKAEGALKEANKA